MTQALRLARRPARQSPP